MIDDILKKMEEDAKNKLWDMVISFGSQVNAKRSFIYWDEVVKVLDNVTYLDTDDKLLLRQDLEQKVNIILKPNREDNEVDTCKTCKHQYSDPGKEPCYICSYGINSKWEPKEDQK